MSRSVNDLLLRDYLVLYDGGSLHPERVRQPQEEFIHMSQRRRQHRGGSLRMVTPASVRYGRHHDRRSSSDRSSEGHDHGHHHGHRHRHDRD